MFSNTSSLNSSQLGFIHSHGADSGDGTQSTLVPHLDSTGRDTFLPVSSPESAQHTKLPTNLSTPNFVEVNSRNFIEVLLGESVDTSTPIMPSEIEPLLSGSVEIPSHSDQINQSECMFEMMIEDQAHNLGIIAEDEAESFAEELDAIFADPVSTVSETGDSCTLKHRSNMATLPSVASSTALLFDECSASY
eukprot:IDg8154t1